MRHSLVRPPIRLGDHREARRQHRGISSTSESLTHLPLAPQQARKGALTANLDDDDDTTTEERGEVQQIEAENFPTLQNVINLMPCFRSGKAILDARCRSCQPAYMYRFPVHAGGCGVELRPNVIRRAVWPTRRDMVIGVHVYIRHLRF